MEGEEKALTGRIESEEAKTREERKRGEAGRADRIFKKREMYKSVGLKYSGRGGRSSL